MTLLLDPDVTGLDSEARRGQAGAMLGA